MPHERELLERYRKLARDTTLHAQLTAYANRTLSTACPSAPPAHLLQHRRDLPPPTRSFRARGKGRGKAGAVPVASPRRPSPHTAERSPQSARES